MASIFEHEVKKCKEKLNFTDLSIMNSYGKDANTVHLTDEERKDAEKLIEEKGFKVDGIVPLSYCLWLGDIKGRKYWNSLCGSVMKNINKEQWNLLVKYYSSQYIETPEGEEHAL